MDTIFDAITCEVLSPIDTLKEALLSVAEQNSASYNRFAVELTLECSSNTRRQTGLLLLDLLKSGVLPAEQVFEGLQEILDDAENVASDVHQMWLCLSQLLSPMLHGGGIFMAEIYDQIRTRVPPKEASVLLLL